MQYVSASGTMKGDFAGMTASGKSGTWQEVRIVRMHSPRRPPDTYQTAARRLPDGPPRLPEAGSISV